MSESPEGFFQKTKARFRPGGVGRHISWLLFHSGIEAVTMTIASLVATRYFGPVKFGQLALLLTGVQLIANLGDGLYNSLVKVISDGRAREESGVGYRAWRFLWIALLFIIGMAVLMGAGLAGLFP